MPEMEQCKVETAFGFCAIFLHDVFVRGDDSCLLNGNLRIEPFGKIVTSF